MASENTFEESVRKLISSATEFAVDYSDLPQKNGDIKMSPNAKEVFNRRYRRKNKDGKYAETIPETFQRVANHLANAEENPQTRDYYSRYFYNFLSDFRFVPNSPTWTGAGTPLGQLAACFVLPLKDDMGKEDGGIFDTLKNAALIQQTGGGNGFPLSFLRPTGDVVKTSMGKASGPVSFLEVYDGAFGNIAQGGVRRGANMAVMRVSHPDIRDFITCKSNEGSVSNFNISVAITDDFMEAVREDGDFELVNPRDGKVWETARAREIFDLIVENAHKNGEPGVLFIDEANRHNPVPNQYSLEATNPCFVGSTRIATSQGLQTISQLVGQEDSGLEVATDRRVPTTINKNSDNQFGVTLRLTSRIWKTRTDAPVMELKTKQGYLVTATPDHPFLTPNKGYQKLQDMETGDKILLQSGEGEWGQNWELPNRQLFESKVSVMAQGGDHSSGNTVTRADFSDKYQNVPNKWSQELGQVIGWLVGDGWLSPSSNSPVGMTFSDLQVRRELHQNLKEWFGEGHLTNRGNHEQLSYGRLPYEFFISLGVMAVKAAEKRVSESIWSAPREAVVGFLRGLFTADGSVQRNDDKQDCTVRLASSSEKLLQEVQLLLSNFGIISRIYHRRNARQQELPNGRGGAKEYQTQDQYELVIGKSNRDQFAREIGFISTSKQEKLENFINGMTRGAYKENFVDEIISVEDVGTADVYDLTEPATHSLIANGLVAHNCGEQWLGTYENCCLGHVNFAQHLTKEGQIDWESLAETTWMGTRFLDNVVTQNAYVDAVPQLKKAAHKNRRIGLGYMGLGDVMYELGVRYGNEEGAELAAQLTEFVRYHSMLASISLAKERGAFPGIEGSIYDPDELRWQAPTPLKKYQHDWDRPEVNWEQVVSGLKEYGIRNATQMTVAPTGTTSSIGDVEGYGCEPVFALAYYRNMYQAAGDDEKVTLKYVSPRFNTALEELDLSDKERQEIVDEVIEKGSIQHLDDLPAKLRDTFVVAGDITPEEHVLMQASIQAFVDNSISKTCNFSEEASEQDVHDAYFKAWETECKGLTVYRQGSREEIVLETEETKSKKTSSSASTPTKPVEPSQPSYVVRPRPKVLRGETHKIPTPLGTMFMTVNHNGQEELHEVFATVGRAGTDIRADTEALGRLISLIFRLGPRATSQQKLGAVIDQLLGIKGGLMTTFDEERVSSIPDAIAKVLMRVKEPDRMVEQEELGLETAATSASAPALEENPQSRQQRGELCPECGNYTVVQTEGCKKCLPGMGGCGEYSVC